MIFLYGMVDRQRALSFTPSQDHCEWFSPSQISVTLTAEFEPKQNLIQPLLNEKLCSSSDHDAIAP